MASRCKRKPAHLVNPVQPPLTPSAELSNPLDVTVYSFSLRPNISSTTMNLVVDADATGDIIGPTITAATTVEHSFTVPLGRDGKASPLPSLKRSPSLPGLVEDFQGEVVTPRLQSERMRPKKTSTQNVNACPPRSLE